MYADLAKDCDVIKVSSQFIPKIYSQKDDLQNLSLYAPFSALGLTSQRTFSYKNTITNNARIRNQVGFTNRWRLPEHLGSDLLGTSQALRAISAPPHKLRSTGDVSPRAADSRLHNPPYKPRQVSDVSASFTSPTYEFKKSVKRTSQTFSVFSNYSKKGIENPDISLKCLRTKWSLHSRYILKSPVLVKLFTNCIRKGNKKKLLRKQKSAGDIHVPSSSSKDNENLYAALRRRSSDYEQTTRRSEIYNIELSVDEPLLTKSGFSVALAQLYRSEIDISTVKQIVPVLAAAQLLEMNELSDKKWMQFPTEILSLLDLSHLRMPIEYRCEEVMFLTLCASSFFTYHGAATKFRLDNCINFCERWLELNLVTEVAKTIHLKDVSRQLFESTIFSERLFTDCEFSIYQTICYWIYFDLNPDISCFPSSFSTIMSFFNARSKQPLSYLETEDGFPYKTLMNAVRFSGITDATHLNQIRTMGLVSRSEIVDILARHLDSFHCGGDMFSVFEFSSRSVRWGIIIPDKEKYDPELVTLYGFYFNLKVERVEKACHLYFKRLRPTESNLSSQTRERQTCSLRPNRPSIYSISVHALHPTDTVYHTTGVLTYNFRMIEKNTQSQELIIEDPMFPLYATFSLLFPRS